MNCMKCNSFLKKCISPNINLVRSYTEYMQFPHFFGLYVIITSDRKSPLLLYTVS